MGLDSSFAVKEEVVDDSGGFLWSNKMPTPPCFTSLKFAQEEKLFNFVSDRNAPHGFGGLDSFDAAQKRMSGELSNVHAMHHNPSYKTHLGIAGQNFSAQQFLERIPVTVIPSVAGSIGPWLNSNGYVAPAQLTIFYGGTLNISDDITLDKTQAIMFMARNRCDPPTVVQPSYQVQASASKPATFDGPFMNKTPNSLSGSGLSIPMSISSHPIGGNYVNKGEGKSSKSATISLPLISKVEPPRILGSLGSIGETNIMPAAIPKARKASLANFLEKHKERVMSSIPYSLGKKGVESTNPDSIDACFSGTSTITMSPLLVEKKT